VAAAAAAGATAVAAAAAAVAAAGTADTGLAEEGFAGAQAAAGWGWSICKCLAEKRTRSEVIRRIGRVSNLPVSALPVSAAPVSARRLRLNSARSHLAQPAGRASGATPRQTGSSSNRSRLPCAAATVRPRASDGQPGSPVGQSGSPVAERPVAAPDLGLTFDARSGGGGRPGTSLSRESRGRFCPASAAPVSTPVSALVPAPPVSAPPVSDLESVSEPELASDSDSDSASELDPSVSEAVSEVVSESESDLAKPQSPPQLASTAHSLNAEAVGGRAITSSRPPSNESPAPGNNSRTISVG